MHTLACGHVFHASCLVEWLVKRPPFACPYCRVPTGDAASPSLPPEPSVTINEAEIQAMLYPLVVRSRRGGFCSALRRKVKAYCKARKSMLYWQYVIDCHYNYGYGYYRHLTAMTGLMYRSLLDSKIEFATRAVQLM